MFMKRYIHMELALVWVWSFIRSYGVNQVILSPSPLGSQNAVILLIARLVDMCEYAGLNFSYLIHKTLHCTCAVVFLSKASNQMCCLSVIFFCLTWASETADRKVEKCIYDTKAKELSTACSLWGFFLSIRNSSLEETKVSAFHWPQLSSCTNIHSTPFLPTHPMTGKCTYL